METELIQPESIDPIASLSNVIVLSQSHGVIVGAIHRINPKGMQSTLFFFYDGYVHEANGFLLYDPSKPQKEDLSQHLLFMKMALQMIPCLAIALENDELVNSCLNDSTRESLKKDLTVNIIFRPPTQFIKKINYINQSRGAGVLDKAISEYYIQTNCYIFEVTDNV